ncbi:MAG: 2-C-methyl-D-erythritol 4-phosphate cytidylyltransferase [Chitinophagaceae bacterium]|nr:2-C-methyl-D-erythritol 4-phosphate cytidylyltransferase [Chitinophagaceae bacterium]
MNKKYALIAAAGSGTRMGSFLPKQFLCINEKPILYYTIRCFQETFSDINIILILPGDYLEFGKQLIQEYFPEKIIQLVAGGDTRFQSVQNGLKLVGEDSIVFVHDGVRCLASSELLKRCYEAATKTGSAIPVIRCKDSVRLCTENKHAVFDRNKVLLVQTPQTFQSNILLPAFQTAYKDSFTDEASVLEEYGARLTLVEGEETNIKITTPSDLLLAEAILKINQKTG